MSQRISSWSYSRKQVYDQCPFKAKLLYIEKMKEPPSKAMDDGAKKHKELEDYLKGSDDRTPQCALKLEAEYVALKAERPYVELEVAFNDKWQPVDWFDKKAWARIKIDALVKKPDWAKIVDHKSGKIRDGYDEQLGLYSLTGLLMFPNIDLIKTANYYVDAGKIIDGNDYKQEDREKLRLEWEAKVEPMLTDTTFNATPNKYCYSCAFRKSEGGPCKHD